MVEKSRERTYRFQRSLPIMVELPNCPSAQLDHQTGNPWADKPRHTLLPDGRNGRQRVPVVLILDDRIHHPVGRCGPRCPSIAAATPGGRCQKRKKQRRTAPETGDHSSGAPPPRGLIRARRVSRSSSHRPPPTPTDPPSYARVRLTPRKR